MCCEIRSTHTLYTNYAAANIGATSANKSWATGNKECEIIFITTHKTGAAKSHKAKVSSRSYTQRKRARTSVLREGEWVRRGRECYAECVVRGQVCYGRINVSCEDEYVTGGVRHAAQCHAVVHVNSVPHRVSADVPLLPCFLDRVSNCVLVWAVAS